MLPKGMVAAARPSHDGDLVLRIGHIPSARLDPLITLAPGDSLKRAQSLLTRHRIGQIPVLTDHKALVGVVTTKSIMFADLCRAPALRSAVRQTSPVSIDEELHKVLPALREQGFVLVLDESSQVSGVITLGDALTEMDRLSGPHRALGEIERRLRQLVSRAYPTEVQLRAASRKPAVTEVEELTLGAIERILRTSDCWVKLGWQADQDLFVTDVEAARNTRNKFAHHRGAALVSLTDTELRHLEDFLIWLRELDSSW
ncbi:CBS domain-containing protein [Nonomuraea typhae]|uniref:CBS domain-containing protein n=1 Tax=Nonomuraea typhae TaxID=2603600 RepID=A0ABW7YJH8_9ACTN